MVKQRKLKNTMNFLFGNLFVVALVLGCAVAVLDSSDYVHYELLDSEYRTQPLPFTNSNNDLESLHNYPNATDPTYNELIAFLKNDRTDEIPYSNDFVCADYAVRVHNNAEEAGIKSAVVGVDFYGDSDGHALNAFRTTDNGLMFIDCTNSGIGNSDTIIADLAINNQYHSTPLFESDYIYENLGTVSNIDIIW